MSSLWSRVGLTHRSVKQCLKMEGMGNDQTHGVFFNCIILLEMDPLVHFNAVPRYYHGVNFKQGITKALFITKVLP